MKTFTSCLTRSCSKRGSAILIVLLGFLACCASTFAQSGAGSIQGTITDSTGAVIAGASIHVVQKSTNVAFNTISNSAGLYQVPSLFTGVYVVTISAPGFKTQISTVDVLVDQNRAINAILTAGEVTQQVEVNANTVQLTTTDNGTISSTLENARINQLPMNGRTLYTLVGETTPGLEASGQRANGLLNQALEYVADGVSLTNRQLGSLTQASLPDPDSVQEVRTETTNTSALYATPATAVITTKSGTNSLHGSFFETARNNAIGIAKGRQNPSNFAAPHLVRNEFGASAGGPIILPHLYHGKDKSFWFFAYERYSLEQTGSDPMSVPTTAMRGGDFSGLVNSSGVLQQLYDPMTTQSAAANWSRTAFANNQIPATRIAPTSKVLFDLTPPPTSADNPLVASNLIATAPNNVIIPTITFRLDHTFNDNNRGYIKFTDNFLTQITLRQSSSPATLAADGFPAAASGLTSTPADTVGAGIGFTHVFSPTFFSETVLSQQWYTQRNFAGGSPLTNFEQKLGTPNNFGEVGFPSFSLPIGTFPGTQFIYGMSQIVTNLDENLTKTVGRHQMQFGGRYRHERFGTLPDESPDSIGFGAYATALEDPTSGTNYTATPNTGYAEADMFLGAASSYGAVLNPPYTHFHDMEFDAYFQDNYHVSRNLTANIGLRYEAHPAMWVKDNLQNGLDLKTDAEVLASTPAALIAKGYTTQAIITNLENIGVIFETAQQAGYPSALIKSYNLNFSPRIGLAYTPFGDKHGTVIRGAYGRYTFPIPARNSLKNLLQNQPFEDSYSQSYTSPAQSPDGLSNYLLRSQQQVFMGTNSSGVVNTSSTNSILPGASPWVFAPNYAPTFVTEMNATVEQPLKGNSALRVSWTWAHAANLDHPYYLNNHPSNYTWEMETGIVPPNGGASVIGTSQQNTYASTALGPYDQTKYGGSLLWQAKDGWSNDNSLEVNYQRLFHHGIAYQISYAWSKPMRLGGNSSRDGLVYTAASYLGANGAPIAGTMTSPFGDVVAPILPPARPAGIAPYSDYKALAHYEQYVLDNAIPLHHITFNGIVDLPFGRGKRFLGNSSRFLNEVVGGFQLAGDGNIVTQDFSLQLHTSSVNPAINWGPTHPLKVYKGGAKITDCRSGVCHPSREWFNGYLAPTVNADVDCTSACVSGLPSGWVPFQTPVDNTPGTANYGTNNVQVTAPNLNGGTPATVAYSPGTTGSYPFSKTFLNGPINYTVDLSIFKVFPITETVNLRFNMDAFNALNVQGYNNPNILDGTEAIAPGGVSNSANTPRQVQFTARLTF
ncbi:MAG TPA: carboxypeptidase-like regulatory domain-containing protein [Terracidiphilus sp.]|nr:carboxypeptidase-like regulatory domain-containing protein [Terracidiphilus sp.]